MGELWDFLPAGGVQRFAFDAAWQSTLVCLIGIGLAPMVRPRPAARAAILFAVGILCIAAPVASAAAGYGGWGVFTFAESTDPVRAFGAIPVATEGHPRPVVHAATVPAAVAMPRDGAGASLLDGTRWALGISWCAASAVLCCGSGIARWRFAARVVWGNRATIRKLSPRSESSADDWRCSATVDSLPGY